MAQGKISKNARRSGLMSKASQQVVVENDITRGKVFVEVRNALKEAGIRDKVKVMIGGAPVTQNYCDEITADGYSADAASAVDKAKELLGI